MTSRAIVAYFDFSKLKAAPPRVCCCVRRYYAFYDVSYSLVTSLVILTFFDFFSELKAQLRRQSNGIGPSNHTDEIRSSPNKKRKRRRKVKDYDWGAKSGKTKKSHVKKIVGNSDISPSESAAKNEKSGQTGVTASLRPSSNVNNSNNTNHAAGVRDSERAAKKKVMRSRKFSSSSLRSCSSPSEVKRKTRTPSLDEDSDSSSQQTPVLSRRLRTRELRSNEKRSEQDTSPPPQSNGTFLGSGPQYQSINKINPLCNAQVAFAKPWISGLISNASGLCQNSFKFLAKTSQTFGTRARESSRLFSKYRDLARDYALEEDYDDTSSSDIESSLSDDVTSDDSDDVTQSDCDADNNDFGKDAKNAWLFEKINREQSFGLGATVGEEKVVGPKNGLNLEISLNDSNKTLKGETNKDSEPQETEKIEWKSCDNETEESDPSRDDVCVDADVIPTSPVLEQSCEGDCNFGEKDDDNVLLRDNARDSINGNLLSSEENVAENFVTRNNGVDCSLTMANTSVHEGRGETEEEFFHQRKQESVGFHDKITTGDSQRFNQVCELV